MVHRLVMYLIRHGETRSNVQRRYIGWRNQEMSEQGRKQVDFLKKRLPELPKIYASDLDRCSETASILSSSVETTKKLREYNFGDFDGGTYEELKEGIHYKQWLNNMEKVTPPNGESFVDFKGRVLRFADQILGYQRNLEEPIVVVTHGGVIRIMLHHWSKESNSMWDWPIAPGEAYKILLEKEREQWILSQVEHITGS
ncbi:histidine phosphatase family protein [Halobacillus shinanisalinarum]|uniref:Histidine phosphatase family protein n=1 Tax=Halobacillus shinanisalinarum TaxID=2932258 RepID=A0ABY4H5H0_9BACI|nr:histidine phosphatase family protein [Halobacillus shinanisalinarum]UOQ95403.1 histidine phosphatase family protein [Halobacillus shinanisalinarum]